ncbi:MAG: hypothetical protein NTX30_04760 [Deltaproteobacteria bacterium]|nr:hypothetical protein [Deltaproteobacteria bacterium]
MREDLLRKIEPLKEELKNREKALPAHTKRRSSGWRSRNGKK